MKTLLISSGIGAYIVAGFLTFGVLWNESGCGSNTVSTFCRFAAVGSAFGGALWPIQWAGRLAIDATN